MPLPLQIRSCHTGIISIFNGQRERRCAFPLASRWTRIGVIISHVLQIVHGAQFKLPSVSEKWPSSVHRAKEAEDALVATATSIGIVVL